MLTARGERVVGVVAVAAVAVAVLAFGRVQSGDTEGVPESNVELHVVGAFPCQEDEVLVGVGDFDGEQWLNGWRCEARDDL